MKRSIRLSLASCLLAGLLVGCKSESDSSSVSPPPPSDAHSAEPSVAAEPQPPAWTLEPAVTPGAESPAWSNPPYAPIANAPAPEAPPTDGDPGIPAPENATDAPPPAYAEASPEVQPPAPDGMSFPYDPALDATGTGRRNKSSFSADAIPRAQSRTMNPLRADSAATSSDEPNPLRLSAPQSAYSFTPPAPAHSAENGSAFAPRALVADEPGIAETEQPAAPPPAAYSTRSSAPVESYSDAPAPKAAPVESATPSERAEAENMAMMAMGEPPTTPPPEPTRSATTPPTTPPQPFDTVEVFYGTDRLAWQPNVDHWAAIASRFWPTLAAMVVAAIFGMVATLWKRWLSGVVALCSLFIAVPLGYIATTTTLERARIAEKEGVRYLAERATNGEVQLGICEVTIPKTHSPGELEAPSVLRLEFREDQSKHVVLQKTEQLEGDAFYSKLRERVAGSPDEELFVFVHGFNVSFEDAARRTAQMAHDLKYEGAPVFFSWPANNKFLLSYAQDETNVSWAAPHLKRFLLDVSRNSNAKSVNVIAHSMGNRALTTVLRELELELRDEARLFNQVVLAAPDIDADDFRLNIAPHIQKTSRRITLYASSNDQALAASQLVHRYPRAGDSGQVLVVVPGIETIDVSAIDGGPWGHSYYGSSDPILKDLAVLLSGDHNLPRSWLAAQDYQGLSYWVFQAQAASARAAGASGVLH